LLRNEDKEGEEDREEEEEEEEEDGVEAEGEDKEEEDDQEGEGEGDRIGDREWTETSLKKEDHKDSKGEIETLSTNKERE